MSRVLCLSNGIELLGCYTVSLNASSIKDGDSRMRKAYVQVFEKVRFVLAKATEQTVVAVSILGYSSNCSANLSR